MLKFDSDILVKVPYLIQQVAMTRKNGVRFLRTLTAKMTIIEKHAPKRVTPVPVRAMH